MGIGDGPGMPGTVADQDLGKGWDDGMTVGRERIQTPDTGFIPNSQNQRQNPLILPTAQMAKHTFISHPFLSFRLKFDLEPARISLYLHLTRPFIHHIAHGDTGIKEARTATEISGMHRFSPRTASRAREPGTPRQ